MIRDPFAAPVEGGGISTFASVSEVDHSGGTLDNLLNFFSRGAEIYGAVKSAGQQKPVGTATPKPGVTAQTTFFGFPIWAWGVAAVLAVVGFVLVTRK